MFGDVVIFLWVFNNGLIINYFTGEATSASRQSWSYFPLSFTTTNYIAVGMTRVAWQANCYHAQFITKEITRCFIQGRCIVSGSTGIIEGAFELPMIAIGY